MIESLETIRVEPYDGRAYEWVVARAVYAVDPDDNGGAQIADLSLACRDNDGKVRFSGDVVLLRPTMGGNGRALISVVNRGLIEMPFSGDSVVSGDITAPPSPGDGYLLDEGWTIAFLGWQWDVPARLVGFRPPIVDVEAGWLRSDFRVDAPTEERSLGERMTGRPGFPTIEFAAYPVADVADQSAVMRVRAAQMGPSEVIPRSEWSFTSPTTVALRGGFQPSRWYEVIYRSSHAPVVGTGLLALRDLGAHLRSAHDAVFARGVSQTGRFLREFLYQGLNVDEDGRPVFDGVLIEVASARRGEFNRRFGQPGLLAPQMPEYGPPYDSASLLARQRERGGVPKIMLVNSAWEYWRGDGALVHQDSITGDDLPEDNDTRAHLISGTDHYGSFPGKTMLPVANPVHFLDSGPVVRALFVQLQQWAIDGVEPTPSTVPRRSNQTLATRDEILAIFEKAATPDPAALPYTPSIDPGDTHWPLRLGTPRVALVSAIDSNGNETGGIRLPAVEAGVAAYTGWNPRCHIDGLPDVLFDFAGSRLPNLTGSVPDVEALRVAAERLVERRFLLRADADLVVAPAVSELKRKL